MTRTCFVVRPFGKRKISVKNDAGKADTIKVDFERIHQKLIAPAMERVGLAGGTTATHKEAGNIRTDMFDGLASADVVIADISIQNANVYYELGVRHGLRDKRTVMIRFSGDETPFDIKTDRYLVYDYNAPEESVGALVETLEVTLEGVCVDSPVYQLLGDLIPPDPSVLVLPPDDFRYAVERAKNDKRPGLLELLGDESGYYAWANGGLRLVAEAQFKLKQFEGARETWGALAERADGDAEAYLMLATVTERLDDLTGSDQAVEKALMLGNLTLQQQAEAAALLGRNAKTRWKEIWSKITARDERRSTALKSGFLTVARDQYRNGFHADLNHHFSGINALGLMRITHSLALEFPYIWKSLYQKDRDAETALEEFQEEMPRLAGAVTLALERSQDNEKQVAEDPRWAKLSLAEIQLLADNEPERVAVAYHTALEGGEDFFFNSAGRQLAMYNELGVANDAIEAIINQIPKLHPDNLSEGPTGGREHRVILFSGHRLDAPGRESPRFPPSSEGEARMAIKKKLTELLATHTGAEFTGMAGGANGGDILFHEACEELGIVTELYLAIPPADYARVSVIVEHDPEWKDRYERIRKRCNESNRTWLLQDDEKLPLWMGTRRKDYSIWERNNLWTMHSALAKSGGHGTDVVLLWDGQEGDGPGGTRHMRKIARRRGANVHILHTKEIFELA